MSIISTRPRSRFAIANTAAMVVLALVTAACSSAATAAPAATTVATATASPTVGATASAEPTATAAPTASPTSSPAATGPTTTPMLVDPFSSAGITEVINTVAHSVDESKYVTTVAGISHTTIYVVFALKPETVGKVTMVMTMGGVNVADPLTIDYQVKNSWGDFKINFPSSGMPVGDYQATMTYEPTGAAVTVQFTVT
jgi:hypothetical protein